jgi:arginyl-tRNA--protein-N-Asp/Glu arginylyltransferase
MIYYQQFFPELIRPEELDVYLSKGWYRIQQMLITTDLISNGEQFMAVFWLRYRLGDYQHSTKSRKLLKASSTFTKAIEPFQLTEELEDLFKRYHQQIDFDMSDTANAYLMGDRNENVFNTKLITLRNEGKLVAAGCYDEGADSTMGILNIYDPSYKKYSLGKVLVLLKLEEAMRLQKTWFYPGYISLHTPKFDYKLFPDLTSTEVYNRLLDEWKPYNETDLQQLYDEMIAAFLKQQRE